jgi:hypothetical protein
MNLIPYFAIWAIAALAIGLLALYRRMLTLQEILIASRRERADRVNKGLIVFLAVLGFVILTQAWQAK